MSNYIIYLLYNTEQNNTYIGITNNPDRRIRQHNGELSGGARYTTAKKGNGNWLYYGWITGIDNIILTKNRALSLEKKIKNTSRKMKGMPIEKRISAIYQILSDNSDLFFYIQI